VRNKGNSAFVTQEFMVCVCDKCTEKGARELFTRATGRIMQNKMNTFINVRTIRLKDTHPGDDIYVALNGQQVDSVVLETFSVENNL